MAYIFQCSTQHVFALTVPPHDQPIISSTDHNDYPHSNPNPNHRRWRLWVFLPHGACQSQCLTLNQYFGAPRFHLRSAPRPTMTVLTLHGQWCCASMMGWLHLTKLSTAPGLKRTSHAIRITHISTCGAMIPHLSLSPRLVQSRAAQGPPSSESVSIVLDRNRTDL